MAQLCLWTKIRTKQWLVLGASALECMHAGFLCPKCDNFACLHTRHDQSELQLKRWKIFLPKSASSVSRSQAHLAKCCSSVYLTIFVRRKEKLIICQIGHELSVTIHCFWLFTLWFIDEDASFFHFFSQDNEHTELAVFLFFFKIFTLFFAHLLQHDHDFQYFPALLKRIHNCLRSAEG